VQFDGAVDGVAKFPIFLNILKYFTGLPPVWLAGAASIGYFHPRLPHWTAYCAALNSIFSFMVSVLLIFMAEFKFFYFFAVGPRHGLGHCELHERWWYAAPLQETIPFSYLYLPCSYYRQLLFAVFMDRK
jgi:hypothetical protein